MHDPFKPVVSYQAARRVVGGGWRWLVILGAVLIAALAAVVVIGPSLVDWNAYKGALASAVRQATGRDVVIAGDVSVQLVPRPKLIAEKISLANLPGGSAPEMARVGSLEAHLDPWGLVSGRLRLSSLDLVEPTILLERLPDGSANWTGVLDRLSGLSRGRRLTLDLRRLAITRGTVLYRDAAGEEWRLDSIDATLTAAEGGPIAVEGAGRYGETAIRFGADLANAQGEGPVRFRLAAGQAKAEISGSLNRGDTFGFSGRVKVDSPFLAGTLTELLPEAGKTRMPAGLEQHFSGEAGVELAGPHLKLADLRLELGAAVAAGAADLQLDQRRAELDLAMSRLDLDSWPAAKPAQSGDTAKSWMPELPADWSVAARLAVEALVWRRGVVSQVRVGARLERGRIAIDDAKALLPGGSDLGLVAALEPQQGEWRWQGRLTAASDNLRGLLQWLGLEPAGVPADRLRTLNLTAHLAGGGDSLQASQIDAMLDASHITGGIALVLRQRPGFGIGLAIDQLNLDAYLPGEEQGTATASTAAAQGSLFQSFDANFNLAISDLTVGGTTLTGTRASGTLQNSDLTLRELTVHQLAGGSGRLAGRITGLTTAAPKVELDFGLSAAQATDLIRLVSSPATAEPLGQMTLSGKLSGQLGALKIDLGLTGDALDGEGRIAGTIAQWRPAVIGSAKLHLGLRQPDRLARLLGLTAAFDDVGPIVLDGEVGRDPKGLSADLTLNAAEIKTAATIAGTVKDLDGKPTLDGRIELAAEQDRRFLSALGFDLAPTVPASAGPSPAALRLVASGPLQEVAVDGEVTALGARATARGRVGFDGPARSYELALAVSHPDLARLAAFGHRLEAAPRGLALNVDLSGNGDKCTFTLRPSQLGSVAVSGNGEVAFAQPRPIAKVSLAIGTLPLALLTAPWQGGGHAADAGAGWSADPVDLTMLGRLDGEAKLQIDALTLGAIRIEHAQGVLTLADGRLALPGFAGQLAGGRIEGSASLDAGRRAASALKLAVTGVHLANTPAWGGLSLSGGTLDAGLDLTSAGDSAAAILQGLSGNGRASVRDTVLHGVALGQLGAVVAAPHDAGTADKVIKAATAGDTPLKSADASFVLEHGLVRAPDLVLMAGEATGQGRLSLEPLDWRGEAEIKISLADHPELPPVMLWLSGPLDQPERRLDADAFVAALVPPQPVAPAVNGGKAPAPQGGGAKAPATTGAVSAPATTAPAPASPGATKRSTPPTKQAIPTVPPATPTAPQATNLEPAVPASQPPPQPPASAPAEKTTEEFIKGILDKLHNPEP